MTTLHPELIQLKDQFAQLCTTVEHVEQGRGLHLFRLIGNVKEDAVLDLLKERNPWLRLHRYLPLSPDLLIIEVDATGLLRPMQHSPT